MICDTNDAGANFCKKVETCMIKNMECVQDSDCCTDQGLICIEFDAERKCIPGKRDATDQPIVNEGEDCGVELGPFCDVANNFACINKGAAGFKCLDKTDLPTCGSSGANCDPTDGMPGCCEGMVCVDNKRVAKAFEQNGFAEALGYADFVNGVGDFGRGFDKVCIPKLDQCLLENQYCDLYEGVECCTDDNKPLECRAHFGRMMCKRPPTTAVPPPAPVADEAEYKFFQDMWEAGNPTKVVASKAYTKLDCTKKTLCVWVKTQPGFFLANSISDTWIKDYASSLQSGKYIPQEKIEYIPAADGKGFVGWRGCFDVSSVSGTRSMIEIHGNFGASPTQCGRTTSTGKKRQGYTTLELCP